MTQRKDCLEVLHTRSTAVEFLWQALSQLITWSFQTHTFVAVVICSNSQSVTSLWAQEEKASLCSVSLLILQPTSTFYILQHSYQNTARVLRLRQRSVLFLFAHLELHEGQRHRHTRENSICEIPHQQIQKYSNYNSGTQINHWHHLNELCVSEMPTVKNCWYLISLDILHLVFMA